MKKTEKIPVVSLEDVLLAKENRAARQDEMRRVNRTALFSVTLNIPGAKKVFDGSTELMQTAVKLIEERCSDAGMRIVEERVCYPVTGPEALLAVNAEAAMVKKIAVSVEDSSIFSRLFDIDVIDADGRHINRSDLGLFPRTCFCCSKPAVECIRAKAHDAEELGSRLDYFLQHFQASQTDLWPAVIWDMGSCALEATLLEAACTPAPGLIDRINAGAHEDMDYFTFLHGSAALAPFFYKCAAAGWFHSGTPEELLPVLRVIGQNGEKTMLQATSGINTQRGLLFLMGILLGGAAHLVRCGKKITAGSQLAMAADVCNGIVERELQSLQGGSHPRKLTAGERLFMKYGETGIRGEIEAGLPSVALVGIPRLREAFSNGLCVNDALVHTLVGLMLVTKDTTVLNRRGPEGQDLMRKLAQHASELGGMLTEKGRNAIQHMDDIFSKENISPGGTADLLAATWFVHRMENRKV